MPKTASKIGNGRIRIHIPLISKLKRFWKRDPDNWGNIIKVRVTIERIK